MRASVRGWGWAAAGGPGAALDRTQRGPRATRSDPRGGQSDPKRHPKRVKIQDDVQDRKSCSSRPSWSRLGPLLGPSGLQNRAPAQGGAHFFKNQLFAQNRTRKPNLAAQSAENDPKMAPQDDPKPTREAPRVPQDGPKMIQERPKSGQERPKSGQERPKGGQEQPRCAQEWPRGGQERPRAARSGPKVPQSGPRAAQEQPKVPQATENRRQEAQKRHRKEPQTSGSTMRSKDQREGIRATRAGSIDR